MVAGRGIYWPPLVTVWHREPGGRDSGTVCKHHARHRDATGKWRVKVLRGWRWHVWHWRLQIHPWQHFRRWAFTRCTWCGGRSRKGDPVNNSHQWDGPRGPWWRGERGLYHLDCSSIQRAHLSCTCEVPGKLMHREYGACSNCDLFREFGREQITTDAARLLKTIPTGGRDAEVMARVRAMWADHRAEEEPERVD